MRYSFFLHWNFDWKSCVVVFFLEWNEWKNPQFNFSSQNLSIERNFFKWDGKETKISHLLFHRIWKKFFFLIEMPSLIIFVCMFSRKAAELIHFWFMALLTWWCSKLQHTRRFIYICLEGVYYRSSFPARRPIIRNHNYIDPSKLWR